MSRVSWRDAISMWIAGRVEIIEEYANRFIGVIGGVLPMPAIVRFVKGTVRKRYRMRVKFSRGNVYLRDHGRCQYCGRHVPRDEATYDHVTPKAQGGKTKWANIVIACYTCNQRKADRTPAQARMKLLRAPERPKSLPGVSNDITYQPEMPEVWRGYLGTS
jgi:5-methylcytosine-specific restriction endonuclease McrA